MAILGMLTALAVALTVSGYALHRILLSVAASGAWALASFAALNQSTSPNPTQITDVYMGLFWLGITLTIACLFEALFMRPKKEDEAEEVGLDDTAETEKEFDDIRRETRVPRLGRRKKKKFLL